MKFLTTRRGPVPFPTFLPVITGDRKHPLDQLVWPYLPRLANAVMVSRFYAARLDDRPALPCFVDSGGYAGLLPGGRVENVRGLGCVTGPDGVRIHPRQVLDLQERIADVAFTLDCPIPPGLSRSESVHRLDLTVANAHWAVHHRRRTDLPLYGVVVGWDDASIRTCATALAEQPLDGLAIGGLIPRMRSRSTVLRWVEIVRDIAGVRPLHVFGLGHPDWLSALFERGVQSADSSAWAREAAKGRCWGFPEAMPDPAPLERLQLALCNLAIAAGRSLPVSSWEPLFHTWSTRTHQVNPRAPGSYRPDNEADPVD